MKEFINFIKDYWQYISFAVLALVELILFLFKRKPHYFLEDSSATSELLDLIIDAEKLFGSGKGDEKLHFVLDAYLAKHPDHVAYSNLLIKIIETILKSPQKKGVNL